MYTIYDYLDFLLIGYGISTIIFLLTTLVIKPSKKLKLEYLDVSNLILLILALSVSTIMVFFFIRNYSAEEQNELSFPFYKRQFYTSIFLTGVAPLLFLIKRLRRNVLATLCVVGCVNWFFFYEKVFIWISSFFPDYLPSRWSISYDESPAPYIIAATIIYFIFVILLANKRLKNA